MEDHVRIRHAEPRHPSQETEEDGSEDSEEGREEGVGELEGRDRRKERGGEGSGREMHVGQKVFVGVEGSDGRLRRRGREGGTGSGSRGEVDGVE
jgi:hypothetical protein